MILDMEDNLIFDDFKPATLNVGVYGNTNKAAQKEMTELEKFKIETDDIIFGSEDPKQTLTEMMVEYIQNVGDVNEVNYCCYSNKGEAIDAWSYSGDDDFTSVDLFLTVLIDPENNKTIAKTDIERYFKWLEKFLSRSKSGEIFAFIDDKLSDLYQVAQLVFDAKTINRIRLFLMTNAIAPSNFEKDEKEIDEGTIIEYHIWDVKRIKKHDDILRGKESVVVDFEDIGFSPLPCIKMPDVSNRVECYLSIISGDILAKIYNQYHQHILEQNVRTFLQFKGASNQGIRDTLIGHTPTPKERLKGDEPRPAEPDMFFSYNNGISTTATNIEIEDTEQGSVITKITDWQIVNGGQTTASISAVMKMKNIDPGFIKQVFVAMKVSVIKDKETKNALVPRISRYANTQSVIRQSDLGINEPFLQELEQQSRNVWVKNSLNQDISKWFFERTRGQYMDKAKHTASFKEEREYYEEYPKTQMFDKSLLAKCVLSWEQDPVTVCKGGEKCYLSFFEQMKKNNIHFEDANDYKKTVAKLILFKAIDAYYGRDGVKLAGFKSHMVAYTLAALSRASNKALDLLGIWDEQCVVTPSLYKEMNNNLLPLYIKILMGVESISYKTTVIVSENGKKRKKVELKTVQQSDIDKIKHTKLFKVLMVVSSLHKIVSDHLFDVDAGVAIDTNAKKSVCWSSLCMKHFEDQVSIPSEIIITTTGPVLTPRQICTLNEANDIDCEIWHSINIWGKKTGLINPREIAFMGNIFYQRIRWGKQLTYPQARYAMRVLELAKNKGWKE